MEKLLTIAEAAELLRVSTRTLEREARDGKITIVRVRSIRLVTPAEIERYVAAQSEVKSPSATSAIFGSQAAAAVDSALNLHLRRAEPMTARGRSRLRLRARQWED